MYRCYYQKNLIQGWRGVWRHENSERKAVPRLDVKPMNISTILLRTPGLDHRQAIFEWMLLVRGLIHAFGLGFLSPRIQTPQSFITYNVQSKGQAYREILLVEQSRFCGEVSEHMGSRLIP